MAISINIVWSKMRRTKHYRYKNTFANKKMKSLFSNCTMSAIVHDPEISLYYKRKRAEGKRSRIVLNAIKNKLIHRVFAVINRKSPYVKIMNYV